MDLEFKGAMTFRNPIYNDWKFGATVNTPLVKPIPDYVKTDEELAKLIRFEMAEKEARNKFAQEVNKKIMNDLFEATKNTRKHIIFIATPTHRDIRRYMDDLIRSLSNRNIPVVKTNPLRGEVETERVIAKMVTPTMHHEGLRCDECFGFTYEEARRLKRTLYPGYSELTSVGDYIEKIEKERKEQEKMYENCTAWDIFQNIIKNAGPEIRPLSAKPTIEDVIFNDPATIVMWSDGTKTVVKAENEPYDPEKGLAMAISKKNLGNKHDYYITFKRYLKKYYKNHPEKKPEEQPEQTTAYAPIVKAYGTLMGVAFAKGTKADLEAAITEAIGYLGEALSE